MKPKNKPLASPPRHRQVLPLCVFSTAAAHENENKCQYQPHNENDNCAKRNMIHGILRASALRQPNTTPERLKL